MPIGRTARCPHGKRELRIAGEGAAEATRATPGVMSDDAAAILSETPPEPEVDVYGVAGTEAAA